MDMTVSPVHDADRRLTDTAALPTDPGFLHMAGELFLQWLSRPSWDPLRNTPVDWHNPNHVANTCGVTIWFAARFRNAEIWHLEAEAARFPRRALYWRAHPTIVHYLTVVGDWAVDLTHRQLDSHGPPILVQPVVEYFAPWFSGARVPIADDEWFSVRYPLNGAVYANRGIGIPDQDFPPGVSRGMIDPTSTDPTCR